MEALTIRQIEHAGSEDCVFCSNRMAIRPGPHLFHAEGLVCRRCGGAHAPALTALLDLGRLAERVRGVCRHRLVPPMETLLALARAAEEYNAAAPECLVHSV